MRKTLKRKFHATFHVNQNRSLKMLSRHRQQSIDLTTILTTIRTTKMREPLNSKLCHTMKLSK